MSMWYATCKFLMKITGLHSRRFFNAIFMHEFEVRNERPCANLGHEFVTGSVAGVTYYVVGEAGRVCPRRSGLPFGPWKSSLFCLFGLRPRWDFAWSGL